MLPTLTIGIEYTVTIDDLVILVLEQRKIEFSLETLAQHLAQFLGVFVAVHAHRENLSLVFLLLGQKAFQLPELFNAERSPVAAVEDQHDVLLTAVV